MRTSPESCDDALGSGQLDIDRYDAGSPRRLRW